MLDNGTKGISMNISNSAKVGVAALICLIVLSSSAFAAFAPEREGLSWNKPAKRITFNTVKDNPAIGDERAFVTVRNFNNNNYVDRLKVADKDVIVIRAYYHNNASKDKVAKNVTIKFNIPNLSAKNTSVTGYISADNADPKIVSDTTNVVADKPFTLEYQKGSAQIWNNVLRGLTLSDSMVNSNGTLIGYDKLDGNIPGGSQYSGYVTLKAVVHFKQSSGTITTNGSVPNTGPGEVLGLFAGATAIGTVAHLIVSSRGRH
jgi:hypothetical protein